MADTVDLEIVLRQWGVVEHPYLAYYGQVAVSDIVSWGAAGASLTAKNLRQFRGATDVNESISKTLLNQPTNFWYFNNGLTIVCEKLKKKPLGGNNNDLGSFECTGASVVNGAQTVGSIIEASKNGSSNLGGARVLVRLVSLEVCPDGFGADLTRAANTQNRIEKRDFAALDPNQKRLRTELFLENQKDYAYQSGDKAPQGSEGCTLDEATVALACRVPDVGLAVQAKRELGVLYEDVSKPPYTLLFNSRTTARYLWNSVLIARAVDVTLSAYMSEFEGKEQLILIHGNRFILHAVFANIAQRGDRPEGEIPADVLVIARTAARTTITKATELFPSAYPANLFKNASKCRELARVVLAELGITQVDAQS